MTTTTPPFHLWGIRGGLGRASFATGYAALCLSPLLIARLVRDAADDTATEVSAGLGMVAYSMMLVAFLLSGRFQAISGRAGLDGILGMHRFLGFAAAAMIAGHIVVAQGAGGNDAGPSAFIAVLALVMVIMLARVRSRVGLRYELWRLSHGLGALVVAASGFAHATSDGYYASHGALQLYWGVLLLVAAASLAIVHVGRPLGRMRQLYKVTGVTSVANKTWRVTIAPVHGDAIDFEPGQYAFLSRDRQPFMGSGHPFSFSSAPSQRPDLEFTIKENGDFTDTIGELEIGTRVHLDGPHGYLSPARYRGPGVNHDGLVLIAGGVGIAPMMSILREGAATAQTKPALLIYAANSESDLAYRSELDALSETLNLTVQYILSSPSTDWRGDTGYITADYLTSLSANSELNNRLYFVCGSTRMLEAALSAIAEADLAPPQLVHAENFSIYD